MHHFIWPVKHQRSAIGAVREGKGRTRHWGVRSKARGAHCQGSEGASKEAACRKSLAVRTQKSYGNPQQQHNAWSYTEEIENAGRGHLMGREMREDAATSRNCCLRGTRLWILKNNPAALHEVAGTGASVPMAPPVLRLHTWKDLASCEKWQ